MKKGRARLCSQLSVSSQFFLRPGCALAILLAVRSFLAARQKRRQKQLATFFFPFLRGRGRGRGFFSTSSPLLSSSSSPTIARFPMPSSLASFLFYRFQKVPVARHAAAHADIVAEREPAKSRSDAYEDRVARELADGLLDTGGGGGGAAAVCRVCIAPRGREDWGRHV